MKGTTILVVDLEGWYERFMREQHCAAVWLALCIMDIEERVKEFA